MSFTDAKIELHLTKETTETKKNLSPFLSTEQGEALSLQRKKE